MNKKELNNEIVLCRAAVRKARVVVIRKMLKKMKILKSCKIETMKEKKLKKAEKLFEKVQIMKKVKDDEVTKFALRNSNLESYLKGPQFNVEHNALAYLAKHEAVARKVTSIREKFSDWETELPLLLDSLKKKKKSVKTPDVKTANKQDPQRDGTKTRSESDLVTDKSKKPVKVKSKTNLIKTSVESTIRTSKNLKVSNEGDEESEEDEEDEESEEESSEENNETPGKEILNESVHLEKIDDPFFIEKKVIAPKLLLESNDSVNKNNFPTRKIINDTKRFKREDANSMFQTKPFKIKKDLRMQKPLPALAEEKLHPSWAAKKVKLIRPFEGKKIKFSE